MTGLGKEQIIEALRQRIITMELEPGSHLDESVLAQSYGVSRTPLRDVFRQLAGEGYIEVRDKRGAYVAPLNHSTLRSFFQTAPMVYAAMGRLAAENHRPEQLELLRACQDRFRHAVKTCDLAAQVTENDQFHALIGEMAANLYLLPSYRRLLIDHARIGQTSWSGGASQEEVAASCRHHDEFIQRIEDGDAEGMVALTLEHWELSRQHIDSYVRPDPLPLMNIA